MADAPTPKRCGVRPIVRVLHDVSEAPPAAVAAALDGLVGRLRLAKGMPPVWVQPLGGAGGMARYRPDDDREILISPHSAGLEESDVEQLARRASGVILHELAHRLLIDIDADAGAGHDAPFLATQFLLFLRLGNAIGCDWPCWHQADFYDLHDHADDALVDLGMAVGWAWRIAQKLAPSQRSAEACAAEILESYLSWRQDLEELPARRAVAQRRAAAAREAIAARLSAWRWAASIGWICAGFLLLRWIMR